MEPFAVGFMVTAGVAGGTLVNFLLLTKRINGNGNGNGKAAQVKVELLLTQHVEALQTVCSSIEKARDHAAGDTKEVCDLLAAQSTAIALLHQSQQAHAEHTQAAWRDTFALLRPSGQ